jgi:hypothetical protein
MMHVLHDCPFLTMLGSLRDWGWVQTSVCVAFHGQCCYQYVISSTKGTSLSFAICPLMFELSGVWYVLVC